MATRRPPAVAFMLIRWRSLAIAALLLGGAWNLGYGTWIHAKAILAQLLLEAAWAATLDGGKEVKPWPWADTWPVCRLSVPRLGVRRIVLAGASGATLAFGPGRLLPAPASGSGAHTLIAGHRDTHFRFLKRLRIGDLITLQAADGTIQSYLVSSLDVVDTREASFPAAVPPALSLVTCFPFDGLATGGPLRFVVTAIPHASA